MRDISNRKAVTLIFLAFLLTAGLAKNGFKNTRSESNHDESFNTQTGERSSSAFATAEEKDRVFQFVSSQTQPDSMIGAKRGPAAVRANVPAERMDWMKKKLTYLKTGFKQTARVELPRSQNFKEDGSEISLPFYQTSLDFSEQLSYFVVVQVQAVAARVFVSLSEGHFELKNHDFVVDSNGRHYLYVTTSNCHASLSEFITAILIEMPSEYDGQAKFWIQKKFSRTWTIPREIERTPTWFERENPQAQVQASNLCY